MKGPFFIILLLLIFTPLAFGTVETWSYTVIEILSICLFILIIKQKERPLYRPPGMFPLVIIWCYMVFQIVPLPPSLVKILSPETYNLYRELSEGIDSLSWPSISLYRKATILEIFRFTAYLLFYFSAVQVLSLHEKKEKAVKILFVFISLLGFFSIVQYLLYNNKFYWLREVPEGASPFGPFVNRNHYAFLMTMVFPLLIGLLFYYRPYTGYTSLKARIVEFLIHRRFNIYTLVGFGSIVVATSVFLSLSRGGIVSLSLAMVFFGALYYLVEKNKTGRLIIGISLLIMFSVGWFGWEPIIDRFGKLGILRGEISDLRPQIWRDSLQIIDDFPLTGTGFGTYMKIYPSYRTVGGTKKVDHAHNDYIELLVEGGLIGAAGFLIFVGTVVYSGIKGVFTKRSRLSRLVCIGALSGLLGALLHSFTDFSLHIGADGLYLFFILSLIAVSSDVRKRVQRGIFVSPLLLFMAIVILIMNLLFNAGVIMAKAEYSILAGKSLRDLSDKELKEARRVLLRASRLDPFEGLYPFKLAEVETVEGNIRRSFSLLHRTISLDPLNSEYLQFLGFLYAELGQTDKAERVLRLSIRLDRREPKRYEALAKVLILNNRSREALSQIKEAIRLRPEDTGRYITLLVLYGFDDYQILESLPDMPGPYLVMGRYLEDVGRAELAAVAYERALECMDSSVRVQDFLQISRFYIVGERYEKALAVLRQAVKSFPQNVVLRLRLASVYERAGIGYRAVEEYKKVLMLEPNNKKAISGLRRLSVE
jgi:O-antigen ligase/tetratricopeptide (TPR) repeat protein